MKKKKTDVLIAKTSIGKTKYWIGYVIEQDGKFFTQSEYWQDKGKHIVSSLTPAEPKNVGKKNETTSEEQANSELNTLYNKKIDSGYTIEGAPIKSARPLPMLAKKYKEQKKKLVYPCLAQYKYDGCRTLFDNEFYSRKNKDFIEKCLEHMAKPLKSVKYILDGEIMSEDKSFDKTIPLLKKYRPGESDKLKFYVYDIVELTLTFEKRYELLKNILPKADSIVLAPTVEINNEKELDEFYNDALEKGYEGIMLRNKSGIYKPNHKSIDLLKHKPLEDDEFKIVGAEEGKGRNKGCVVWLIETKNGTITKAPQQGKLEDSKKLYIDRESHFGKMLTVEYQDYTPSGKLRFPSAKTFRDYE